MHLQINDLFLTTGSCYLKTPPPPPILLRLKDHTKIYNMYHGPEQDVFGKGIIFEKPTNKMFMFTLRDVKFRGSNKNVYL